MEVELYKEYTAKVVPALKTKHGYTNLHQIPRVQKVVVNTSIGSAQDTKEALEIAVNELKTITGQTPVRTKSKKAISNFKLRKDQPIGAKVTLRGRHMYEFLERLIKTALPKIRDFRGISPKAFDGQGNYTLGVADQSIFPEIELDKIKRNVGFDVTIVTTARTDEEAKSLLGELGMPFTDRAKKPAAKSILMTSNDPIADLLTRLRNASRARKAELLVPYSRIKADITAILKKEGYITDFEVKSEGKPQLRIVNKFADKTPAITGLKRVSRPGLRRYVGADEIPRVLGGMGVSIISTPRGVLSGREARRQKVGGELLAYVW